MSVRAAAPACKGAAWLEFLPRYTYIRSTHHDGLIYFEFEVLDYSLLTTCTQFYFYQVVSLNIAIVQ